ncbi:MAG: tetratricopeptide repeat protein [bacterium]
MRWFLLASIAIGFCLYPLTYAQQERFEEGERYFRKGDYNRAISIFREIYNRKEKDELSAKSALRLGQCYLAFKAYESARQFFKEARKWGGDIAEEAQMGIALTHLGEKKFDLAINILSELISQSDREKILAYAYYNRALCYEGKNWIKKAMDDLNEAKKRAGKDEKLLQAIKEEMEKCKSLYKGFQEKENSYLEKIKADYSFGDYDGCASSLRELARLCEEWGEMDKAIDYELQAIDYSTSEEFKAGSWMNLAWRYCKEQKYVESAKAFKKVADEYPQSSYAAEALLRAGDMYTSAGKYEEALKCYKEFLVKYPKDERTPTVILNLAWTYFRRGGGDPKELFEEVAKRYPNTEIGYFALGYLNELKAEYEAAISAYQKCIEFKGPYYFLAANGMGNAYYLWGRAGDLEKLQKSYEIFVSLLRREDTPPDIKAEALLRATQVCLNPRMDRKIGYALLWNIRDILLDEENVPLFFPGAKASAFLALGRCYLQLGEPQKAVEIWQTAGRSISSYSPLRRVFEILLERFAHIALQSSLPSKVEKNLDKCSFSSIGSFFYPRGKEYPEIYIIYGTHCSDEQKESYEKFIQNLLSSNSLLTFPKNKLKSLKDEEAREEELGKGNILLIGSLNDNSIIEKVRESLPIRIGQDFVEINGRKYEGKDISVILNFPNPFNKDKDALLIWSNNPSTFPKQFEVLLDFPLQYLIFKGDFTLLREEDILEGGFFYEHPNRVYEAF